MDFSLLQCHLIKLDAFRDEHRSSEVALGLFKHSDEFPHVPATRNVCLHCLQCFLFSNLSVYPKAVIPSPGKLIFFHIRPPLDFFFFNKSLTQRE